MANLVSAGVSVTVTDESFFIPVSAATVPLFFIATQDEKRQPGETGTPGSNPAFDALGTYEHNVIRTVTSLNQSLELYGVPSFLEDENSGAQYHGDARNEYGLFALNQYLGIGNRAYVVRANVNLNDNLDDIRTSWDAKIDDAATVLGVLVENFLREKEQLGAVGSPPGSPPVAVPYPPGSLTTVTAAELISLAQTATEDLFESFSFVSVEDDFFGDGVTPSALDMYPNGYDAAAVGVYDGFDYIINNIASYTGSPGYYGAADAFTSTDATNNLLAAGDDMKFTLEFFNGTSLGANDDARRANIVTAFQESVLKPDLRAETYDYNLVLCPGYPEITDELLALVVDMKEEAMVISDTPMNMDVDTLTGTWTIDNSKISRSPNVAYYYPSALASNLDGTNVACSASGVALRTITYSDNVSFLWFAPAGLRRGLISGITDLGYVSGELGGPTTWVPLALNPGERDILYQYEASGGINPLVSFPGQGFVVWGQKTSQIAASAMDRINVSRLIKYVKRQLRKNTMIFVFQPNDALTRDNLKAVVDNFLGDLVVKRGLYDFVTVCDESNNTPDRIDRNEMYIDIALKPVKAAEFIYIPIRIVATGAEI